MTVPQTPPLEPSAGAAERGGRAPLQLVVPLLFIAAGLLTIVAPFLALFVGQLRPRLSRGLLSVTGWTTESLSNAGHSGRSHDISSAPVGYPLLFAGVLLVAAAVVGLRPARPGSALVQLLPAVGTTFLVATVVTVGMQGIGWAGQVQSVGVSTRPGAGFWLLVAAVIFSVVAALLPPWQPSAPPAVPPPPS